MTGRFVVEKQELVTECSHPLCDQIHERFMEGGVHWTYPTAWHVWDNERNAYADTPEPFYPTRREAKEALADLLR